GAAIGSGRGRTEGARAPPAWEGETPQGGGPWWGGGPPEGRGAPSKLPGPCPNRPASNSLPARARYAWRSRPPASGASARPGPAAARISAAASKDATGRVMDRTSSFWHGRAIHRTNPRRGAEARAALFSPPRPDLPTLFARG